MSFTNTTCWIIGHKATIASNGREYISEPFIVFPTEGAANAAADMIQKVSGERPMIAEGSFYQERGSLKEGNRG